MTLIFPFLANPLLLHADLVAWKGFGLLPHKHRADTLLLRAQIPFLLILQIEQRCLKCQEWQR